MSTKLMYEVKYMRKGGVATSRILTNEYIEELAKDNAKAIARVVLRCSNLQAGIDSPRNYTWNKPGYVFERGAWCITESEVALNPEWGEYAP